MTARRYSSETLDAFQGSERPDLDPAAGGLPLWDAEPVQELPPLWYDYDRQAWVRDGRYVACSHPVTLPCSCYGRIHAGERAPASHYVGA